MSGTNPFRRKDPIEQLSTNVPVGTVNNVFPDRPEASVPPIDTGWQHLLYIPHQVNGN